MTSDIDTKIGAGQRQTLLRAAALVVAALLGGCTVTSTREAPVAERSTPRAEARRAARGSAGQTRWTTAAGGRRHVHGAAGRYAVLDRRRVRA